MSEPRSDPDAVLKELAQDNPEPLSGWLAATGVDLAPVRALPQWNSAEPTPGGQPRHRRLPDGFEGHADRVLGEAFGAVAGTPFGAALLCCYVRSVCEQAWKTSYHFDRMWATLRAARRAWLARRAAVRDDASRAAADLMSILLDVLDWEIAVENEMICNNPYRLAVAAERAAQRAAAALGAAERLLRQHPQLAQFTQFVTASAVASRQVDTALAQAGRALHEFLCGRDADSTDNTGHPADGGSTDDASSPDDASATADGGPTEDGSSTGGSGPTADGGSAGDAGAGGGGGDPGVLDQALRLLAQAERSFACDRDQRSELRAYRNSLEALREQAAADWLYIDEGTVVHAYPFAVRGVPPAAVVAKVRQAGGSWGFAGVRPDAVHQTLYLDDIWNGSDAMGRRYEGAVIVLPEVTIADLSGRPLGRFVADLRLSELGNHYLRLRADLHDTPAHGLYGAMLRSAPEHAEVEVRCGDSGRVWPRLSALAVDVIDSLSAWLGPPAAVSVRPGMFHVLVTVLEASLGTGPHAARHQRRPVTTAEQLSSAVGGGVLQQPVPHIIGAPAEWVHYSTPGTDLTAEVGARRDELILQTCNTTVLAALGSPGYWISTRLTVAEFVASLEGLFAGWFDELATFLARVTTQSGWPDPNSTDDIEELTRRALLLEREQMRLYAFAADTRSTVDLIRSPALVASPLVFRQLLALLHASSFDRREAELSRNIDAVLDDRLGYWLDTLVRRRREREAQLAQARERRQRVRLDTLLAVIAAVGVSGLGQIAQAGYDLRQIDAVWLISVIVVFMVVVGAVARWWSSDFGRSRPQSEEQQSEEQATQYGPLPTQHGPLPTQCGPLPTQRGPLPTRHGPLAVPDAGRDDVDARYGGT